MNKILEVKNVTKIYKIYKSNFDRLKELFLNKSCHKEYISNSDISFDLFEGETLGIIGVNGAGKSTILKQIAGVITPTSGEILRYGRITALLELGTGFNFELTGYENIYLNGTLIGMTNKEIDLKIEEIINFSELGEYINEPIKTYSSGMTMRLAFSIAIFSQPQVLIVDEALSVGDAHFSAKCTRALKQRKEQKMSIIYVSHDLNSLKLLCDRVILLNHGKLIDEGNPEEVINHYNFLISQLNEENTIYIKDTKNSFGNFSAELIEIKLLGLNSKSNVICSGEETKLTFKIKANENINDVNIGFLIKDKFGQDIYGTSTKNFEKTYNLKKGRVYRINIIFPLNIGNGKYSLSAALAIGDTHLENCLHWLDFACDFEIAGNLGEEFIGLSKLYPKIDELVVVDE
jgi:lipopolysaccharide transport system ATP-binding protein